jgi:hypothetical protein
MRGDWFRDLLHHRWRLAAVLLLSFLFLTNIYRAATQSIAHDEGVIFEWLLSGSWGRVLTFEHGNHHVLSDLLCKLMITLFGPSELSLRTPALLGGLLYFYSVFRISALLFGEGFLMLLAVSLLSLNPFVLDYLACARGYGPALGLFFFALYQLAGYLAQTGDRKGQLRALHKAGAALGLSIGANVIMIFPGGAVAAALLAMLWMDRFARRGEVPARAIAANPKKKPRNKEERKREPRQPDSAEAWGWRPALVHFVFPAGATGGLISMLPNRLIELEEGYMGPPSLGAILGGLVRYSFVHSPWGVSGLAAFFPAGTAIWLVTNVVAPLGLAGVVAAGIRIYARGRGKGLETLPVIDRFLLLLAVALPAGVALIVASRHLFGQPYPELRTAMYWIPLSGLAGVSLVRWLRGGARAAKFVSAALAGLLGLCVVQFGTQYNTRYFAEWPYCAAGKDMMRIVRAEHAGNSAGARVRIGATWQLEPVTNYYRVAWRMDWVDPVYRESPDNAYDYYLLAYDDTALVERLHLKALLRDRLSGTVLAKRADGVGMETGAGR